MSYAKIKNGTVVKFPYLFADLAEDNPYTLFDNRFTLTEWFSQTEEATINGFSLVEVVDQDAPDHDRSTHYVKQNTTPEFINGQWILGWSVIPWPRVAPVAQPQE